MATEAELQTEDDLQHEVLEALLGAPRYNEWLVSLTRPYLGDDPLEIGSGLGYHAEAWLSLGVPRLTVSERHPRLVEALRSRFAADPRVDVAELELGDAGEATHSALVALNVLEHVEDDVAALRAARALVRPGGAVVIFVPAFPFAMSDFDRAIGHYRRYTKELLRRAFVAAGLEVETLRYVNAPGLPAWVVGMKVLRRTPRDGAVLAAWDRLVVPVARAIEERVAPPFGQSLLGVARVPAAGAPER